MYSQFSFVDFNSLFKQKARISARLYKSNTLLTSLHYINDNWNYCDRTRISISETLDAIYLLLKRAFRPFLIYIYLHSRAQCPESCYCSIKNRKTKLLKNVQWRDTPSNVWIFKMWNISIIGAAFLLKTITTRER